MPPHAQRVEVAGEELWLHPERAAFWPAPSLLLLSDLHIGKAAHFRRHGIPVPGALAETNWKRLDHLVEAFQPQGLLVLGDLFHSAGNPETDELADWRMRHEGLRIQLVPGNHDILDEAAYAALGLEVLATSLRLGPFHFSHKPAATSREGYNLAGHVHPGVRLQGVGRQQANLPCFWFGKEAGLLPAFGEFTGKYMLSPSEGDQVYVVAGRELVRVG